MDIVYLITDTLTGLKYLGSKKNWEGPGTYWGSPNCKSKNLKKYPLQQEWKDNLKKSPDTFTFEVLESFENIEHSELIEKELEYQYNLDAIASMDFINAGYAKAGFCGDITKRLTKEAEKERRRKISIGVRKNLDSLTEDERKNRFSKPRETNPNWKGGVSVKYCECGKKITGKNKTCKNCMEYDRGGDKNEFYGKTHTQEVRNIISKANIGRIPPNIKRVEIEGMQYNSLAEASRKLDIHITTIRHRLISKNPKFIDYKYL